MYIKFYTDNFYKNTNIFVTNKIDELQILAEQIKQKEKNQEYIIGDTNDKYTY